MPHVTVKLYPGKSERQKARLGEKIVQDVVKALGVEEKWGSVTMEEVDAEDWTEKVYAPDIENAGGTLYRKPGYGALT